MGNDNFQYPDTFNGLTQVVNDIESELNTIAGLNGTQLSTVDPESWAGVLGEFGKTLYRVMMRSQSLITVVETFGESESRPAFKPVLEPECEADMRSLAVACATVNDTAFSTVGDWCNMTLSAVQTAKGWLDV